MNLPLAEYHWPNTGQKWPAGGDALGSAIAPNERLPWPQATAMGLQPMVAMFGSAVLAPRLMGFDPNIAILMSGLGTLVFFAVARGQGAELSGLLLRLHRRDAGGHAPTSPLPTASSRRCCPGFWRA